MTSIREFTNHNKIITPIYIDVDSDYFLHLQQLFKDIRKDLVSKNIDSCYIDILDEYQSILISTLQKYFEGDLLAAQQNVDTLIKEMIAVDDAFAVSKINNSISFYDADNIISEKTFQGNKQEFFRARVSNGFTEYKKMEMLHIPFNQRHLISTQRFSVPGLPCLYLGTTSYCCWLEVGTPADDNFNVSPIYIDDNFKILNLTVNSFVLQLISNTTENENILKSTFKLWLLTLASSYKVRQNARTFKTEYIIPQLLMLSCKKNGLNGVAYFSKQVKNDRFAYKICVNLALFSEYNGEKKLSDMCRKIEIANSFNYAMYKQLLPSLKYKQHQLNIENTKYITNIGDYRRQFPYGETEFYCFDRYLFAHLHTEMGCVDVEQINQEE